MTNLPQLQRTKAQREAIAKEWIAVKDTTSIRDFVADKDRLSIASVYNYVREFGLGSGGKAKGKVATTTTPAPTTLAGMRAEIERTKAALAELESGYITLLRKEAEDLKAAYEAAQQELLDYDTTPRQSPAEHYANMTKATNLSQ